MAYIVLYRKYQCLQRGSILSTNSKGDTMNDTTLTKVQDKAGVQDASGTSVSTEVDKVIIGSIAAFTGVIGLWSVACLMSAMFQAGGPLQLFQGWLSAISGM